ncbi:hypothetical protein LPJ64_004734, partial [Coemansia asiatica]
RHGGIAANAAGTTGAKLGAVEGAAKGAAEKITGRDKVARERENMDTVANPYQNQQHVHNQQYVADRPLGATNDGLHTQGYGQQQHHIPSDNNAKLDPLGNPNYSQQAGQQQHHQYRQNLSGVPVDGRANDSQF